MRPFRPWLLLLLSVAFPATLAAQLPASTSAPATPLPSPVQLVANLGKPPSRDAQAVAIVQRAIDVMGGGSNLALVRSDLVQGTVAPTAGSIANAGNFQWEDDFSGATYEFRNQFRERDGTIKLFVSGHGRPGLANGSATRNLQPHVGYAAVPFHVPAVVLSRALSDPNLSIGLPGPVSLNGQPTLHVHLSVDTGVVETLLSPQDWYFDMNSGLPLRVVYRVPDTMNMMDFYESSIDFSDYRLVNGIAVPFQMNISERGVPYCVTKITSIAFDSLTTASDFDLPAGRAQ